MVSGRLIHALFLGKETAEAKAGAILIGEALHYWRAYVTQAK